VRAVPGKLFLWRRRIAIAARLTAAFGGGYVCTAALVGSGALLLTLLGGLPRSEAVTLSAMLGFVLYLLLLIWSFTEPKLWRVCALPLAGVLLGTALNYWLAPALTARTLVGY